MYRNAFLSEFSFEDGSDVDLVIKCHLLSNRTVVIPAGTALSSRIGRILAENIPALGNGAVSLAHGSDCRDLAGYVEKYSSAEWPSSLLDVFRHFDTHDLRTVYQTETTITQFNELMRGGAAGRNEDLASIFVRPDLSAAILREQSEFSLPRYFELIDQYGGTPKEKAALRAHAKYFYNYFGAFSTSAGNTFSLENTVGFDHIRAGYDQGGAGARSGIEVLISTALDLTDGIEDLAFLSEMNGDLLGKLTYADLLEIRESWLFQTVLQKYDDLVQACAASYTDMQAGDLDSAVRCIEKAFEIRESMLETVRLSIKSEVGAYKIYRLTRFVADTSLRLVGTFGGVKSLAETAPRISLG